MDGAALAELAVEAAAEAVAGAAEAGAGAGDGAVLVTAPALLGAVTDAEEVIGADVATGGGLLVAAGGVAGAVARAGVRKPWRPATGRGAWR